MLSATSLTSYVFENGRLATTTYSAANPVDAVSSLFMVDNIYNEYVADPGVGASTEWVVTFPTKRFYVDNYSNPDRRAKQWHCGRASVRPQVWFQRRSCRHVVLAGRSAVLESCKS